jgi:hypothetical protein
MIHIHTASQDTTAFGWFSDAKSCVIFITLANFPLYFFQLALAVPNAAVPNMFDYLKKEFDKKTKMVSECRSGVLVLCRGYRSHLCMAACLIVIQS